MSKSFNALNGFELKTIILKEVEQGLLLDPRFDGTDLILSALVVFSLRVDWYPGGETPIQIRVSELLKASETQPLTPHDLRPAILRRITKELDGDLSFGQNLTYPKVTYQHLLDLTITRVDGGVVERSVPAVPVAPLPPAPSRVVAPERIVDLRTPLRPIVPTAPVVDPRAEKMADLRRQLAELEGPGIAPAPVRLSSAEIRHRDFEPFTATGLEMERGFKEAPGLEAAASFGRGSTVGTLQPREAIDRIVLGGTHPTLDDGGLGKADAVRREAGLVIPETVSVRGQIVDVPRGTF